ncbi:MAG: alpha-amylase family glycosyl hydrolase [Ruminococcus sp.]|nr:alpha-amylase family glycosyl hydrolase [Ruminococcus sp.]
MKKLKGILGIVLTACMLLSCFSIGMSASAADVATEKTGQPTSTQQNIEDGVILHALCWGYKEIEKNIPAIAAAGYTAVQTSPVQQPKDMNTSTNVSGQWWKLYQPVSLSIAQNSWVGTESDLKSLCTTAHKYNVKIICDIVSNHLGSGLVNDQDDPHVLSEDVKKYEPTLYNGNGKVTGNQYFHQDFTNATDGNNCTTGLVTGCPDLNSGNSTVQSKVSALLKQCVNCGVDGFRFDAAKHIETNTGFWTKIISDANTAAGSKKLFYYGEVLNTVGGGRSMSTYTSLNGGKFRVTDNKQSSAIRNGVTGHNAGSAVNASYGLSGGASHAVLWAESHDTYLGNNESGEITTGVSDSDIIKSWALVASRKDATALFFARTNGMKMGASSKNTSYKDVAVAEVNKFHNNFAGQSEKAGSSGSIAYVARGGKGIVLVNVNGNSTKASVSGTGLSDGKYKDMVTGAEFTVSGGTVSGQIGASGVAVVMQSDTTPMAFADVESGTFSGDTLTVGLRLSNAVSGTYQLENYAATKFTGTPKIKIGSDYNYGDTITLKLTATDGKQTTESVYQYTKVEAASSGVYILIPASAVKSAGWATPIYCYLYDQVSGDGGKVGGYVYKNAAWPGEMLEFDEKLNCYYLEVGDKTAIAEKTLAVDRAGNVTKSEAAGVKTFDLAHSKNTHVILSDSSKSSGGISQGKQFPASGSKRTLDLGGSSKKLTQLSGTPSSTIFQNTTDVPGQQAPVAATEVKKGGAPATEPPTTTESSTETTTAPPSGLLYGDSDLDGRVSIKDATLIQEHAAYLKTLTGNALAVSDVNSDKNVNVKDATCIQCFLANLSGAGRTNQSFSG